MEGDDYFVVAEGLDGVFVGFAGDGGNVQVVIDGEPLDGLFFGLGLGFLGSLGFRRGGFFGL